MTLFAAQVNGEGAKCRGYVHRLSRSLFRDGAAPTGRDTSPGYRSYSHLKLGGPAPVTVVRLSPSGDRATYLRVTDPHDTVVLRETATVGRREIRAPVRRQPRRAGGHRSGRLEWSLRYTDEPATRSAAAG